MEKNLSFISIRMRIGGIERLRGDTLLLKLVSVRGKFACWALSLVCALTLSACSTIQDPSTATRTDTEQPDATSQGPSADGAFGDVKQYQLGLYTDWPELLIANDLVHAMLQIDSLNPETRTIRLPPFRSTFDEALEHALVKSGYQVERVEARTGKGVMMNSWMLQGKGQTASGSEFTSTKEPTSGSAQLFTYILGIDRIAMRRTYSIDGKVVAPASSLYVRGVSPRSIVLDDRRFVEEYVN